MKICIDPGHGGSSTGAAGKRSLEKDINLQLSIKLRDRLAESGIEIVMTRSTDIYLDLQERCDIANRNNCDYFISIHCNSFSDSRASGTETFYYQGSKEGMDLASAIQNAAVAYNSNNNRGIKTADFYVINYTIMPAVLHEVAFISNDKEEQMMQGSDWQYGYTKTLAAAIYNYLGMSPIVPEYPDSVKNPITDLSRATPEQMESFVHRVNSNAPYLAKLYIQTGMEEGIRGDIAFAQAIIETNYFRFTGDVKPEQNNFAGIGSTGGVRGAYFKTVEDGIRAHIQHLKAYANKERLKTQLVDPRFNLVERGSAPNFEDLNGKWAVPGDGYGESIINIWRRILSE